MPSILCCKECTKRSMACHATCETYQNEKTALIKYKTEQKKENEQSQYILKTLRRESPTYKFKPW